MSEAARRTRRCVFCRMPTADRFLRLPMCPICRDQSYDFVMATGVQVVMAPIVGITLRQFATEEGLLFVALIVLKHRIVPPWERKAH